MNVNARALILKDLDYQEGDKIITLFAENEGKMAVVAKGVKKAKSSLRGCVQPFCYSELQIYRGKSNMGTVTQGKIRDFFGNAREDLGLTLQCMHLMELLDKSLPEHQPEPHLFELSVTLLNLLNTQTFHPLWMRYFELAVIRVLGVSPVLKACLQCGRQNLRSGLMSPEQGGLLCEACGRNFPGLIPMRVEPLALLNHISGWPACDLAALGRIKASSRAELELEACLERYIEHHIEKQLMVKKNLRLLQTNK